MQVSFNFFLVSWLGCRLGFCEEQTFFLWNKSQTVENLSNKSLISKILKCSSFCRFLFTFAHFSSFLGTQGSIGFQFFWTRWISIHNLIFSPVVRFFLFGTHEIPLVFRVMHSGSLIKNIITPFSFSAHNPTIRFHSICICSDFLLDPKDPRMTPNRHPKLPKLFKFSVFFTFYAYFVKLFVFFDASDFSDFCATFANFSIHIVA